MRGESYVFDYFNDGRPIRGLYLYSLIISTTTTIPYAMMAISLFVSVCLVILLCLMCVATCIACSLTKDHDVYVHLLSTACAAMGVGNEMAEADTWE